MTGQQTIAFRDPCYNAEDTTKREYVSSLCHSGRAFGVVMTLNVGLE